MQLRLSRASLWLHRFLLSSVLLGAACLKIADFIRGEPVGTLPFLAAVIEVVVAGWLVADVRCSRAAVWSATAFLLAAVGVGVYRSWGAGGATQSCGCLGREVPLLNWQQLAVSSALLVVAGALLLRVRAD